MRSVIWALALCVSLGSFLVSEVMVEGGAVAEARSGSSTRGGSFSSSSSSSSSSSTSSSSSSTSSFASSSSVDERPSSSFAHDTSSGYTQSFESEGGGGDGKRYGWIIGLVFMMAIFFVPFVHSAWQKKYGATIGTDGVSRAKTWKTALLEVAVRDPERVMQHRLETLAATSDLSSPRGLRTFLESIFLEFRRHKSCIDHGRMAVSRGTAPQVEATFNGWMSDARAKFDRDVWRRDGDEVHEGERNMPTDGLHDEDGALAVQEYVVLSLAIAWEHGPTPKAKLGSIDDLIKRVGELGHISTDMLRVVEVVWSPAAESDAMDRADMTTHYPELTPFV